MKSTLAILFILSAILIGCSTKHKCIEYQNGFCKAEEIIYQIKK